MKYLHLMLVCVASCFFTGCEREVSTYEVDFFGFGEFEQVEVSLNGESVFWGRLFFNHISNRNATMTVKSLSEEAQFLVEVRYRRDETEDWHEAVSIQKDVTLVLEAGCYVKVWWQQDGSVLSIEQSHEIFPAL